MNKQNYPRNLNKSRMEKETKKKKKKVKVVYVDDGRTVYDMSGVTRPSQVVFPEKKKGKDILLLVIMLW